LAYADADADADMLREKNIVPLLKSIAKEQDDKKVKCNVKVN